MHGSNTRNLSVQLSLSQTSKNAMFFLLSLMVFFFYKIGEQEERGRRGRRGGTNNVYTCKNMQK
jgi:hypothetical protein